MGRGKGKSEARVGRVRPSSFALDGHLDPNEHSMCNIEKPSSVDVSRKRCKIQEKIDDILKGEILRSKNPVAVRSDAKRK